eukprot:RCo039866
MSVNWAEIRAKLPTERTPEAKAKRAELFTLFDPNGNGYLSLAEVDRGLGPILHLAAIFDQKPVIMRAFQAAKKVHKHKGGHSRGDDYVERCEFRLLLVYLRQYLELFQLFKKMDTSGDHKVSLSELTAALPQLRTLGIDIADPKAAFAQIDANHGGSILFDEFSHWALEKHLHLQTSEE